MSGLEKELKEIRFKEYVLYAAAVLMLIILSFIFSRRLLGAEICVIINLIVFVAVIVAWLFYFPILRKKAHDKYPNGEIMKRNNLEPEFKFLRFLEFAFYAGAIGVLGMILSPFFDFLEMKYKLMICAIIVVEFILGKLFLFPWLRKKAHNKYPNG